MADDGFTTSTAEALGHNQWSTHAMLDYGYEPLVIEVDGRSVAVPVQHDLVAQVAVAYGLWDRLVLHASLPIHLAMLGDDFGDASADGSGLGDLAFGARVRVLADDRQPFALALQLNGTAPTARATDANQTVSGSSTATLHPEAVASLRFDSIRVLANLGVRVRQGANFPSVSINDELTYGLAGAFGLARDVWLWGELFGATTVQDFGDREASPLELLVGPKWMPCSGLIVGGALGAGLLPGYGTPLVRVAAMAGYRPSGPRCDPPPQPPPPPADRDGDGYVDDQDGCPGQAEDFDDFEDEDGCPEQDNDDDGVLDVDDTCPLVAEDRDGFADEDGCPEPDNDGDGLLDGTDSCPNEPGPAEAGGCPDPDRDGDGVPDRLDNCPAEKGPAENQGCKRKQLVVIHATELEILEKVYFVRGSSRLQRRSHAVLDNVAAVLAAHPEIERVRIEGHTDSRGSERYNQRLSEKRAQRVLGFLASRGVDRGRLAAVGWGESQPLADNESAEGRARNRRVEFDIVQPEDAAPTQVSGQQGE